MHTSYADVFNGVPTPAHLLLLLLQISAFLLDCPQKPIHLFFLPHFHHQRLSEKKIIKIDDLLSRITVLYPSFENNNKAELAVSCNPSDLEVFADETQVTLCLINLVKNALQANENNPDGRILISAGIRDNRPEICVIDNGTGIQPEILEEIFVPFFTTRDEGNGIGLSISRQIMRLHGGSLSAKSTPGRETVFGMTF